MKIITLMKNIPAIENCVQRLLEGCSVMIKCTFYNDVHRVHEESVCGAKRVNRNKCILSLTVKQYMIPILKTPVSLSLIKGAN